MVFKQFLYDLEINLSNNCSHLLQIKIELVSDLSQIMFPFPLFCKVMFWTRLRNKTKQLTNKFLWPKPRGICYLWLLQKNYMLINVSFHYSLNSFFSCFYICLHAKAKTIKDLCVICFIKNNAHFLFTSVYASFNSSGVKGGVSS